MADGDPELQPASGWSAHPDGPEEEERPVRLSQTPSPRSEAQAGQGTLL